MHRLTVGTAGHVDHGKTRLIEALTGIDCDRFAEEKRRGITIDLGFAHLRDGDVQIGFIDVPGHHRFVGNALAGLGGIDMMLLVVAADEGVKPQTREHVAICSLLGIQDAMVALTRIDLADATLRELAASEVAELLAGGAWESAPIVPVSSVSGEGVKEIERRLLEAAHQTDSRPQIDRPTRLPVDRCFRMSGQGTVVTGTLAAGRVEPGDQLEVYPHGGGVRVRGIQVHGENRNAAEAGERTALQLAGDDLESIARGSTLAAPDSLASSRRLLARLRLLADAPQDLGGWQPVVLFHGSAEIPAEARGADGDIEIGTESLAEIKLSRELPVARGDRIILRRPSPPATIGGGTVLDPQWRHRRGRHRREALAALEDDDKALPYWVREAGEEGLVAEDMARRLGTHQAAAESLLARLEESGKALHAAESGHSGGLSGGHWVAAGVVERVARRGRRVLERYFQRHRLALSLSKAEAAESLLTPGGRRLADAYFRWLQAAEVLRVEDDRVHLPGLEPRLDSEESDLARRILESMEASGLQPPGPAELARTLESSPKITEGVIGYLLERRELQRLSGGLLVARSALDELKRDLPRAGWDTFSVADFKERYGLSRKWAIPLLEYLDSAGLTRRVGDRRQIVRPSRG